MCFPCFFVMHWKSTWLLHGSCMTPQRPLKLSWVGPGHPFYPTRHRPARFLTRPVKNSHGVFVEHAIVSSKAFINSGLLSTCCIIVVRVSGVYDAIASVGWVGGCLGAPHRGCFWLGVACLSSFDVAVLLFRLPHARASNAPSSCPPPRAYVARD